LRLKILKKLRTASLNSEFTGSYKKSVGSHFSESCMIECSLLDFQSILSIPFGKYQGQGYI